MSVKQVSVYDGSSWVTEDIGANASNITLGSTIGGTTNLQEALTRFLPASTITKSKIVITNSDGKLTASNFAVSDLNNLANIPSDIQAQINAEKTARQEADSALSTNFTNQINAEKAARETVDNNLIENKANQSDLQDLSEEVENKANQQDLQTLSARMDNLVNNTVDTETVLWEGNLSGKSSESITLSDNVANYDYIDLYINTQGDGDEIYTIPSNQQSTTFRCVNLANTPINATTPRPYLTAEEIYLNLSGTTAYFSSQYQWHWVGTSSSNAEMLSAEYGNNNNNNNDPMNIKRKASLITLHKIVGRKLVENTEVSDIRIGYDSTQYNSAGQAVREQIKDLRNLIRTITTEGGDTDTALLLQLQEDLGNEIAIRENIDNSKANQVDLNALSSRMNEYLSNKTDDQTVLWEGSLNGSGATATLSDDIANYDYIDFHIDADGLGEIKTVPSDQDVIVFRFLNLPNALNNASTNSTTITIYEIDISLLGKTATINFANSWTWNGSSSANATLTHYANGGGSTLTIKKIVGRKIITNSEVEDLRIGADGQTEYASAGQAVRTQIRELQTILNNTAAGQSLDTAKLASLQAKISTEITNRQTAENRYKSYIANSEKVLWTGTKRALNTIFNLIDDITNYDYLDFYVDFYGQNEIRTIETSTFLSMGGSYLREVQIDAQGNLAICSLNFGLNESYTNQLKLGEHTIWSWNGAAAGSSTTYSVTTDTGGTYPNGFAVIRKIVGRKDLSKLFS